MADLIFYNANVVTLDPERPTAEVVAVGDGRIRGVGFRHELPWMVGRTTRLVDCQGGTLLPAFHDAHCHLLALAASWLAVDCSPQNAGTVGELLALVQQRVETAGEGEWIRARGYHEALLEEHRHPLRWELDQAAPRHPVRLVHQSGHASVVNSLALERLGVTRDRNDPPGGVIERDAGGEPTGVLLEMETWLDERLPALTRREVEAGVYQATRSLLASGVASVEDASISNDLARWDLWDRFRSQGMLPVRLTVMPGVGHLDGFVEAGLTFGAGDEWLRVGHVKAMLTLTSGDLHPPLDVLHQRLARAVHQGFPAAVHAVEAEAIVAALEVLRGMHGSRHRIEHASECPGWLAHELAAAGVTVVTQPGFVYWNGDRYVREVEPERQEELYAFRTLREAGVRLGAGSDAPVAPADPVAGIYGAVTRRTRGGRALHPEQALSASEAMRLYTAGAAAAGGMGDALGAITPGKLADLVLLDKGLLLDNPEAPGETGVLMTVVGGRVAWEKGPH